MSFADLFDTPGGALGRLVTSGEPGFLEAVKGDMSAAALRGEAGHRRLVLLGLSAHLKFGPLRGKSSLRHAARRLALNAPPPRLREFQNLAWLRRNGFGAPQPLVAGVWFRGALPHFQFLATQHVEAPTLAELGARPADPLRAPALRELGFEVARMHARGFVHRDVFPRNVLVGAGPGAPPILFLDAWRGGPGPGLRGPAYDLACFFLDAAALFDREEQGLFLGAYLAERVVLRKPAGERFLAAVARQRRSLVRHVEARRRRGRAVPAPLPDWEPPPAIVRP